jgi:hypothetical protein
MPAVPFSQKPCFAIELLSIVGNTGYLNRDGRKIKPISLAGSVWFI